MTQDRNHLVIMAGGVGSRFWPMSTEDNPKQFIDILGVGRTLLQLTYDRFKKICPLENVWVVTNKKYAALVREQLPEVPAENILLEPCRRNTAPCIAYVTWHINDPADSKIISCIIDRFQIGKQVFDLFSCIEVHAADNLIWNIGYDKFFLKKTGLCIGAVKNGTVTVMISAVLHAGIDILCDIFCLLIACLKLFKTDLFTFLIICPECFSFSSHIVGDHSVCSI